MPRPARLLPALVMLFWAACAPAAPMDPALQQQLIAVYDNYHKAIAAGKVDAILALTSRELGTSIKAETKTDKAKRETIAMLQMMAPDSVSVVHTFVDAAGTHARIVTVASKTVPKGIKSPNAPPPGTIMHSGLTLGFIKEGTAWKFNEQIFGADPSEVKPCKSETADPESSYDTGRNVSAGGPIVRVDFKPDYTLIVFSVVGEANCAYLPAKDVLVKSGIDPAALVPYAIVTMDGIPHRNDPQKMRADKIEVQPEQ